MLLLFTLQAQLAHLQHQQERQQGAQVPLQQLVSPTQTSLLSSWLRLANNDHAEFRPFFERPPHGPPSIKIVADDGTNASRQPWAATRGALRKSTGPVGEHGLRRPAGQYTRWQDLVCPSWLKYWLCSSDRNHGWRKCSCGASIGRRFAGENKFETLTRGIISLISGSEPRLKTTLWWQRRQI